MSLKINRAWPLGLAIALTSGLAFAAPAKAWEPTKEVEFVSHAGTTSSTWTFLNEIAEIAREEKLFPHGVRIRIIEGARGAKSRTYAAVEKAGDPNVIQVLAPTQINNPILVNSSTNYEKFRGIATMLVTTKVLAVNANSPYKTMDDLINDAKARPGQVNQGGGFVGTTSSLINRIMEDRLGIDLTYIPFDDQGVVQLVGGHVDFVIERPEQIFKFVKSGQLRLLASSTKLGPYPDVPTFKEAGYDFPLLDSYQGFWTSKSVPDEAVEYYVKALDKVRQSPRYKQYLDKNEATELWQTGAEIDAFIKNEHETYLKLDTEMNLIEKEPK